MAEQSLMHLSRAEQDRIMHTMLVEKGLLHPSATLRMTERCRLIYFGDELDEVISWLSPAQRRAVLQAGPLGVRTGIPTLRVLQSYRLVKRKSTILTEDGETVHRRLNGPRADVG